MSAVPEWLVEQLRDFPVLAVVVGLVLLVIQLADCRDRALRRDERQTSLLLTTELRTVIADLRAHTLDVERRSTAELERNERGHAATVRAKDAEIRRLNRLVSRLLDERKE